MKATLLDAETRASVALRAQQLVPGTSPKWGRMDLIAMINHLNLSFMSASGELELPRALIGRLFGGLAKRRFVLSEAPLMKNSPTDPRLLKGEGTFEATLAEFLERLEKFGASGGIGDRPHAFFGPLSREEWGWLMAKHVDHHLRQFGV